MMEFVKRIRRSLKEGAWNDHETDRTVKVYQVAADQPYPTCGCVSTAGLRLGHYYPAVRRCVHHTLKPFGVQRAKHGKPFQIVFFMRPRSVAPRSVGHGESNN